MTLLLTALFTLAAAHAQPPRAAFEAISIKPNKSEDARPGMDLQPGGRFTMRNAPVRAVFVMAYNLPFQTTRLSGGPDWINNERYDIDATPAAVAFPPGMPEQQRKEKVRQMLQSLLADRFHLVIKRESKEMQLYALTVSKGGPKLPKSKFDEKDCP